MLVVVEGRDLGHADMQVLDLAFKCRKCTNLQSLRDLSQLKA